jgi:hypothetical protein
MRYIIRAVKDRVEFIAYLQKHLPQSEWCFDKTRNAMDTFLDAMKMAGDDACVHMEEDILLTQDFVHKINAEIAQRPNELIQFFSMRNADLIEGSRHDKSYMMNQCFYLPAGYSRMIYEFYANWNGKIKDPTGTDIMINDWLKIRKEKYWISIPSLVEHRICKSAINPRRSSKRQSKTFVNPIND